MRLTALVEREDHVCCRYRLAAFRSALASAGHELELRPWPRHWWQWFRLPKDLAASDVVIWQRRLLAPWKLLLLRRASKRLLFDFDDAVFFRDSYARRGFHSQRRQRCFAAIVRTVDAVVAGNSYLAEQALWWHPQQVVHVIPTCVEVDRYAAHWPPSPHGKLATSHQQGIVRLVWIGSASTLQGLEAIKPMLEEIGRHIPGLRLKIICDRFIQLSHLPVEECPWSAETETAELAQADIGISWIPDDLWSRGKCGLKVLQYMAAGLPVVANAVGVHPEIIEPGTTGYLANRAEEWIAAIAQLAADPAQRQRLGQNGRQRVERAYSVQAGAAAWLALLRDFQRPARLAG